MPEDNQEYWRAKFERTMERDARARTALEGLGWNVLLVWECAIKGDSLAGVVASLVARSERAG